MFPCCSAEQVDDAALAEMFARWSQLLQEFLEAIWAADR